MVGITPYYLSKTGVFWTQVPGPRAKTPKKLQFLPPKFSRNTPFRPKTCKPQPQKTAKNGIFTCKKDKKHPVLTRKQWPKLQNIEKKPCFCRTLIKNCHGLIPIFAVFNTLAVHFLTNEFFSPKIYSHLRCANILPMGTYLP